ncbi:MAG: hypothetical protein LUI14_08040 [Lachnospiraceae bacterium]|nr:hypothetical protein [Lachnospiraceae bacterium]
MNNQDFEMSDTHLKNQKSNELFLEYMDYIFFEMDWKYKMDEIEQIYLKPNLDQLIYKALIILGMI